ncbi:hypothetical protein [Microbispora sp. H13382]|uniref:hypothetical protein n=1 Tax=Microbispora sp. H13382 TaxID=2729112 RepID=UPI00160151D4|nr:hypothetical protein [Microbispora sp. H13382]
MTLEDFVASDPRDIVLVRLGDNVVRLFPGNVERPVADVDRALLVADAIDDVLVARLGFGVRDLVEAALGYVDAAIRAMAPSWPEGDFIDEASVTLTAAEVNAAAELVTLGTPSELSKSPRLARALEWATCDAAALPYMIGHPQSPFGRFLRVRRPNHGGRADWLPLAFLPEITGFGVTELAASVADSPEANRRFAQLVAAQVRHALWRFSTTVIGPNDFPDGPAVTPGNAVQWVAMLGPRRALAVQVVARLHLAALPFDGPPVALSIADAARANPDEPISVPMAGRTLQLPTGTEVVPLLVLATAGHVMAPSYKGMAGISLDELRWAATSADEDSDLFMFCREMARPDRPHLFGWETINVWEWWRANGKILFVGGEDPAFMSIAPHLGDAEWKRAVHLAGLERALATLQLPALRDIDGIDHASSGPPVVYHWRSPGPSDSGDMTDVTEAVPGSAL